MMTSELYNVIMPLADDIYKSVNELNDKVDNIQNALEKGEPLKTKAKMEEDDNKWPQDGDKYWYVTEYVDVNGYPWAESLIDIQLKESGNFFKTKEEAEQAVEKLKAWKRLKDAGFEFVVDNLEPDLMFGEKTFMESYNSIGFKINKWNESIAEDFVLLFGGENV